MTYRPVPMRASSAGRSSSPVELPSPAGCGCRRHCRWCAGPACAPSSCPARSPAAHHRAPVRGRAWPRPRHRRGCWPCAAQMRPLLHLHEGRQHLLARGIEQERGLAVLAGAAHRRRPGGRRTARHVRREHHRRLAGADLARTQARNGALTGTPAHLFQRRPAPARARAEVYQ